MKSVMDSVCEFLAGCPLIDPKLPFYLDFVDDSDCYCVTTVPNVPYRKDILGNRIYTVTFQFAYRTAISNDVERGKNIEFLEGFCRWIDEQNDGRGFPVLEDNQTGVSLRVVETGCLDEAAEDRITGVYVTQLEFVYKQKVRKNNGN